MQEVVFQKTDALNSCTAASISPSSVNASAILDRHATTGFTPDPISFAACTSKRVLAPSSRPLPFRLRVMCANLTSFSALDWSMPGHCTFIGTKGKRRLGNTSQALIKDIIETAYDGGADMIVTPCPVCQMNIEVYQYHINQKYKTNCKMPVVYYSTLMSVAYGKNGREAGLDGQVIKARQIEEVASNQDQRPAGNRTFTSKAPRRGAFIGVFRPPEQRHGAAAGTSRPVMSR